METENPYGLMAALEQGGPITMGTFLILVFMSLATWFIIITKYFDQQKVIKQAKEVDKKFWTASSLRDGADKLEKNSAYRQLVDDGLRASEHHEGRLTDKIDQREWVEMSLRRSNAAIADKLSSGLSLLATVGSTSPFIGLFGTVIGIYRALIAIGIAGQASIDKVAGPVGEALIMTAIGLAVAVPAVLGYNWLIRRNKAVVDRLNNFAADIQGSMMAGAQLQPAMGSSAMAAAAPGPMPASASTITPSAAVKGGSAAPGSPNLAKG